MNGNSRNLVTYLRSRLEISGRTSFPRSSTRRRAHARRGWRSAELRKSGALTNRSCPKTSYAAGLIDGHQPHLVEIHPFSSIGSMKRKLTRPFRAFTLRAGHSSTRPGRNVSLPGPRPHGDHAGPDHVRDEFILTAIPREQNGARASAPIKFGNVCTFFAARFISSCGTPVATAAEQLQRAPPSRARQESRGVLPR